MMSKLIVQLLVISSLLAACTSQKQNTLCHDPDAGMAQFADDKHFQDAHPAPRALDTTFVGAMVRFPVAAGDSANAYLVRPETPNNRYLLVFHEWWGLNDYIRKEAEKWCTDLNCNVLAVDLYDGRVAAKPEDAAKLMQSCSEDRAKAIIAAAANYAGPTADFRTIGWCFGGGWSLKAAILLGEKIKGCAVYYGMPENNVDQLKTLTTDVIFIHAQRDKWITDEVVAGFEKNMAAAGKSVTVRRYDADHAFSNPSSPRYHEPAAKAAREQVKAYLVSK